MAKGAFWSFTGAVISRGLVLLSSIIVAHILGKAVFGELGIIQSTIQMFGVFAGFGLGTTSTRYVAELRDKDPGRAGRVIALAEIVTAITGGLMMLLLYAFAPFLAERTLAAPHLTGLLRIGSVLLFLNAVNSVQTGALAGFESFRTIANLNLYIGLASFALTLAGVFIGGLSGVVWGMTGAMAFAYVINHVAIKKEAKKHTIRIDYARALAERRVLFSFSLPACLSSTMVLPVTWVCNTMLVNTPSGYAEMGLFNAANQWRNAILFIPIALGGIVLPLLTNLRGRDDKASYKKVLVYNIYLNGAVTVVLAGIVSLFAAAIMRLYGPEFAGGAVVLVCLVASAVFVSINGVIGQAIASKSKMWWGFLFNVLWGAALIVLSHYFIGKGLGALGLAIAFLLAYFLHTVWQALYLART